MKKLILVFILLGSMYARNCIEVGSHGEWCYDQSTLQAFYMLEDIAIDGGPVDSDDIVGAFLNDECVGYYNADPGGYTTIPLMGNDGDFPEYMSNGDVANLVYFDVSNDAILPMTPGDVLPGWGINATFIISGTSTANNLFGCTDSDACNYDSAATADDGSCAAFDCAGECGGSAEVDECGECGGPGILDGECDCAGNVFDCAGACGGSSANDVCGVCDGDGSSCLGCTTDCADNYDSDAIWDDGSQCDYTVPGVSDLAAASGPSRVILSWSAPYSMCDASYTYDVLDANGEFVKSTSATTTQIVGLEADVEHCFAVQSVNQFGSSSSSDLVCAVAETSVGISWGLQLTADINGWGSFDASDSNNKLGVSPASTYSYDSAFDIPEPQSMGNYVSLYFPHPEWDTQWGDNFTQDVVTEDDEFFEHNLTTWDVEVISNMSGEASVSFNYLNSPLGVPMYVELNGESHSISDGSSVDFFLSQGNVQSLRIYIGNIVPTVGSGALSADGGDRSIALSWDASAGLYPATSYKLYREGAADLGGLSSLSLLDDEDREGHADQGLLYESEWGYTLTSSNAAGESTDGYSVRASGGAQSNIDGTQSDASATTDDNLDPISIVAHVESLDGTNLGAGAYEIPHNGSPDANEITIHIDGSSSHDDDEFDSISSFSWTQTDGSEDLSLSGDDSDDVSFSVSNVHDGATKSFTLNLHVTADYPIRGGSATRESDASISVSIDDEPNADPSAAAGLDLIVTGDGASDTTMDDFHNSDGNDYDGDDQLWYVPHDGDPESSSASLYFDASASSDDDDDDLSYEFKLIAGEIEGFSFTDLNDNGSYDLGEPFELDGGDEIYVTEIDASSEITYSDNLPSDIYVVKMIVTDAYGDSDESSIIVGVEGERNEGPSVSVGDDQQWYMNTDEDEKDISMSSNSVDDSDSDELAYSWSYDGPGVDGGQASTSGELPDYPSLPNDQSLIEGSHTFTLSVSDNYGASASASFSITIDNEPGSVAPVALNIVDPYNAFKHIRIEWNEGVLDRADFTGDDGVEHYTGDLNNTEYFKVYLNGEEVASYANDAGDGATYAHHEESLAADSDYSFTVEAFNSDDEGGASDDASHHTHARPTVSVLNPNGSEIHTFDDSRFDNDDYSVEFSTTNDRFIASIDIEFLSQNGWVNEDDDEGSIDGSADGDDNGSYSASVDSDGTEIYNDGSIRITVTDIGDYNGANQESNNDASDNSFTLAAHSLSNSFSEGWHMFGSAMDVGGASSTLMDDNVGSLGTWGADWLAFDADGAYEDLSLNHGEGFYLALSNSSSGLLSLEYGQPVTGDPSNGDSFSSLDISDGWNLIANPLVTEVEKGDIGVTSGGITLAWEDAVDAGWVAPTINGWFGDSHSPYSRLQPWGGYWINSSRDLSLSFAPVESGLAREASDEVWMLTLNVRDTQGNASGDYITIGLSEDANSSFKYGEDEYDMPNPANASMIDMHIDNSNWVGTKDVNGISVDAPYFFSDIRSIDYTEYQAWTISADKYNVSNSIELSWISPQDIDADVHLVVNGNVIDMKVDTSIEIEDINSMSVVVGNVNSFMNPVPEQFALSAAYPNPFNPSTNLNLDLNQDGFVSVKVYNVVGQVVAELVNGYMDAGYHTFTWNAGSIASGMYLVRVDAGTHIATQKIMLLK